MLFFPGGCLFVGSRSGIEWCKLWSKIVQRWIFVLRWKLLLEEWTSNNLICKLNQETSFEWQGARICKPHSKMFNQNILMQVAHAYPYISKLLQCSTPVWMICPVPKQGQILCLLSKDLAKTSGLTTCWLCNSPINMCPSVQLIFFFKLKKHIPLQDWNFLLNRQARSTICIHSLRNKQSVIMLITSWQTGGKNETVTDFIFLL